MKSCAVEVGGALAADEHCAHLVEEAILVEEEAGAARVEEAGAARVERTQQETVETIIVS